MIANRKNKIKIHENLFISHMKSKYISNFVFHAKKN